jgi:hypothetical protein
LLDVEADAFNGLDAAVVEMQIANLKHGRRSPDRLR